MMNNIVVIGDSWASAVEADTGLDRGWPEALGIPAKHRMGISGSTAAQWAGDSLGRLTEARNTDTDTAIVSLLGNDARAALVDGVIEAREVTDAVSNMRTVLDALVPRKIYVILYADPFGGQNPQSRVVVPLLNAVIRVACDMPVEFLDLSTCLLSAHFVQGNIHPTRAGHKTIARYMAQVLG